MHTCHTLPDLQYDGMTVVLAYSIGIWLRSQSPLDTLRWGGIMELFKEIAAGRMQLRFYPPPSKVMELKEIDKVNR